MEKTEKGKLSVKDIARLAGVSVATVSRIINRNGRFSKETEKKVLEVIRRCDYHPNQIARSLRIQKNPVVGILVPDVTNEFFARITLEIQQQLLHRGYVSIVCNTMERPEVEQEHVDILRGQQVSGVICISGTSLKNSDFAIPAIYIDRRPSLYQNNEVFIESNNLQGGYIATNKLIADKCRKIALIGFDDNVSPHYSRLDGYRRALSGAGLEYVPGLVHFFKTVSMDIAYHYTRELLRRNPDIDGIFYTSDIYALGGMRAILEMGISIPDAIRIVGFDDISAGQYVRPALTTVHQDIGIFGTLSTDMIISMINEEPVICNHYQIPVQLIERETTLRT